MPSLHPLNIEDINIQSRVQRLLSQMGALKSHTTSNAYDTSWVARLSRDYPTYNFDQALTWLKRNQNDDGSWGSSILHYHDRFVSTLSSIIALKMLGDGFDDDHRIKMGESYLWHEANRMSHDAHDTIAYSLIALGLVKEAANIGLDVPSYMGNAEHIEKKLNLLGSNPALVRHTSLIFSYEAIRMYLPDLVTELTEANGSVGASPSATAAYVLDSNGDVSKSLSYLQDVMEKQGDGGASFIEPFDVFEISWGLNHLYYGGLITPDMPEVKRLLDVLWERWSPERGVAFSTYFHVHDLDETAVTFKLLKWGGYPVTADFFSFYEEKTHFRCYQGEIDLSLSVNVRALDALQHEKTHSNFEAWSQKIVALLRRSDLMGHLWFDKWHVSPYYLTASTILSSLGYIDELLIPRIKWILKTQHPDGGWGYYKQSTAEETAYCLLALFHWDQHVERIDPQIIHNGAGYLWENMNARKFPELWIGKSLYTPHFLVEAVILSAINQYQLYCL